jgi:hypothetical protein
MLGNLKSRGSQGFIIGLPVANMRFTGMRRVGVLHVQLSPALFLLIVKNKDRPSFREDLIRNCLVKPNGLHSGGPRGAKMGREAPLWPLFATTNTRSRPLQLFSKQFLTEARFPTAAILGNTA